MHKAHRRGATEPMSVAACRTHPAWHRAGYEATCARADRASACAEPWVLIHIRSQSARALGTLASQRPRISPRPHTAATVMTATMHLQHRWRRRARRTASAHAATVARRLGLGRSNGPSAWKKATKCSRTTMTCRAAQLIWPLPATSTRRFSPTAAPWPARLTHGAWRCGPGLTQGRSSTICKSAQIKKRYALLCSLTTTAGRH